MISPTDITLPQFPADNELKFLPYLSNSSTPKRSKNRNGRLPRPLLVLIRLDATGKDMRYRHSFFAILRQNFLHCLPPNTIFSHSLQSIIPALALGQMRLKKKGNQKKKKQQQQQPGAHICRKGSKVQENKKTAKKTKENNFL
jgi:hypothetical protein